MNVKYNEGSKIAKKVLGNSRVSTIIGLSQCARHSDYRITSTYYTGTKENVNTTCRPKFNNSYGMHKEVRNKEMLYGHCFCLTLEHFIWKI